MYGTFEQAFQALHLCRTLGLNFHESLALVILTDKAIQTVQPYPT